MNKDPREMTIKELDALYGKPEPIPKITHVLGVAWVTNHDIITIEVLTEASTRLNIRITEAALRALVGQVAGSLSTERPKAN